MQARLRSMHLYKVLFLFVFMGFLFSMPGAGSLPAHAQRDQMVTSDPPQYTIDSGNYSIPAELLSALKAELGDVADRSGSASFYGVGYYEEHSHWAWINLLVADGNLFDPNEIGPSFLYFGVKGQDGWKVVFSENDQKYVSYLDAIPREGLGQQEIELLDGYYLLNQPEPEIVPVPGSSSLISGLLFPWPSSQNPWRFSSNGFHVAGFQSLGVESGALAIDLVPPSGVQTAKVLSMETGTVVNRLECTWNTVLIVRHDGYADSKRFVYLHLQNGTSPVGIGATITRRGQYLGDLRVPVFNGYWSNGTCSSQGSGSFNCERDLNPATGNLCSSSTGRHLHLGFGTDKNIVIDGNVIANLSPGGSYNSTNQENVGTCDASSIPAGFSKCAEEGSGNWCSFSGTKTVYYGANSCYVTEQKSNGVECTNENFGGDPLPGVHKACYVEGGTTTTSWSARYFSGHDHWWDTNNFNNQMCQETISSSTLDKNYGSSAPCNNGVSDNWVAEYNATVNFPTGSYVFQAENDDGLKMWINGTNILERGGSQGWSYICPARSLSGNIPIRAILNEEGGDARVRIAWTMDASVCNPPGNFNKMSPSNGASGQSANLTLSWSSSTGANDYSYCIDTLNNNSCDTGWQGVGNVTSKSLSGLATGTTYYWHVRAHSSGGETYSNDNSWWSFTTQSPVQPPPAPALSSPANGAILNRTASASLSWSTASGATNYYAEFWGGPGTSVNSGWVTGTSWSLGSQWAGTYQWRVKARNGSGQESAWSETRTLYIKPGTPSSLSASVISSSEINLSWSGSSDAPGNIDGYRIYRGGVAVGTVSASTTTYNNIGLTCGTGYTYMVKAYKGSLESDASNTVTPVTQACPAIVQVTRAWTADENWNAKTSFNPDDPIKWIVNVENMTGADVQIILGYVIKDSFGMVVGNWQGQVTTQPGTLSWGLPGTVPATGGTYTFTGSVTYQGATSSRTSSYAVNGPTQTFLDVPLTHQFWKYIEAFYDAGITTGCSTDPMKFCPLNNVTRGEMAVFLERAMGNFNPTPNPSGMFADVPYPGQPASFQAFIEEFYNDGITTGCSTDPLKYCPQNYVTRGEMAVFIERALGNFAPALNPTPIFADVPYPGQPSTFTPFIEQFYLDGITTGCAVNPLRYCPQNKVTRQEMAVFIVRAFGIPLP